MPAITVFSSDLITEIPHPDWAWADAPGRGSGWGPEGRSRCRALARARRSVGGPPHRHRFL